MQTTTIHGIEYTSTDAIIERIIDLTDMNAQLGMSDGRVTEYNALQAALNADSEAQAEEKAAMNHEHNLQLAATEVARAKSDLQFLSGGTPADHRIAYWKNGTRTVRYYTTEEGFLKAIIRLYSDRSVSVHTVD